MSSLKERGRVKRGFAGLLPGFGRSRACRTGPRACCSAWGLVCLVPRLLPIRVSGPGGSRTGRSPAGEAGAAGVLDAAGRDPIIGRRGTGGCVVVVAAGPMGSSGAGAPGCGHPSGWPAARRPRGMGLVRAGSGINQSTAARAGRGQTWGRSRAARGRACSPCLVLCGGGGQGSDVPVAHRVEDVGEQLAGRGDLGDVARLGAAAGDDGVPGWRAPGCRPGCAGPPRPAPSAAAASPAW